MSKTLTYIFTKKRLLSSFIILFFVARTFAQAPVITSFSPSTGPVGTSVTISGTGFAPAAANNIVFFGATMASVTAASATSLTVTIPVGATFEPISVLNSNTALTGYSAKPFITTFTPAKGSITKDDFMPPVSWATAGACQTLIIMDMDGDGKPDLVLSNQYNFTISIFRNISIAGSITTGSFAPRFDVAASNGAFSLAVGDLDGDGKPDLVITHGTVVSVFRNTSTAGSISFAAAVDFAGRGPIDVAIGDLDGDGRPEIVTTYFNNGISIWRNLSTPGSITTSSFAPSVDFPGNNSAAWNNNTGIIISDLDGDGKRDIAICNSSFNTITVFRNTTPPAPTNSAYFAFDKPTDFTVGNGPISIAAGDLDGDAKPDLVVTNLFDSSISVLRNTSAAGSITAGSFAPSVALPGGNDVRNVAIGDLDGDGKPDIVIANTNDLFTHPNPQNSIVSVYRNIATSGSITSSSFATRVDLPAGNLPVGIAIGDLDGDGKPDIAVTDVNDVNNNSNAGALCILRNNPLFPPNTQATNIVFSATTQNSTTATWTNGNGTGRAVFIGATSTGSPVPAGSTTYTANTVYTSGAQIGTSGWYCIYNGTGNTVNITGLSSGAIYRVIVVEYTGNPGAENYLVTTATGNPANVTTLSGGSITINAISLVTPGLTNTSTVQFTATFAMAVTGLSASNFALATTGSISGANITSVTGSGSTYTVTVNTGTGDGTIGLNLANATGLTPAIISPLPFTGQTYTLDKTPPSITISAPSVNTLLSGTGQVTYTVNYADVNFNTSTLTAANITLNSIGSAAGAVSISGSGASYTVTLSGITGSGSLGISIAAGTASDLAGNTAAAAGPSATFLVTPLLSNLATSSGVLDPVFASSITAYSTIVPNATSSLTVTPVIADPNASATVNGGSASTPVSLVVGLNNITVPVTTLDGSASTTYTIKVIRAVPLSNGLPPNIAYGTGKVFITSALPFSITPTNAGGPVPQTNYGQVSIFAGSPTETSGYVNATGTAALFNWPQLSVMDVLGNLYVADSDNNVIRMISPSGVVTTFAGSLTGLTGFTNGTGTAAQFSFPDGVAIDAAGNLYVSDYGNNAIRKITPTGLVTTLYSTTNSFGPGGLSIDGSGNLIVAAQDASQIIMITPAGVASVIAGSTPGYTNGPSASAQFSLPGDVKIDASGNLYVSDFLNNAIRKISPAGIVTTFAGSDVAGNSAGFADGVGTAAIFNNPADLYIAPGGVVYVADMYNNDIRRIMPDGTVSLVAGSAAQAPGDADGIGTAAGLNLPTYIYIDDSGTGYISEIGGNRIRKMALTGYTLKGTLPAGLVFDPTTGIISGNPTIPFAAKTDTVTAYNAYGYSTKIITILIPSTVATLIDLKLSAGTLAPVFASGTTSYTASELNSTASITVTPTATDTTATITVNGIAVTSGAASTSIPLNVGPNTITMVVTAQDGVTTATYTIIVTRAPSADATLSNLTIGNSTLTPVFISGTTNYSATVTNNTTTVAITPTANDPNATVTVNGVSVTSGTASAPIILNVGPNTITTVVTARDGTTTDTYTVIVTRAALSTIATLVDLKLSTGTLAPVFASGTTGYTASELNSTASITVTPTVTATTATITVNGVAVTSGTASSSIPLNVGPNTITTVVTAQDGITKDTYTVVVTRAASSDALLSNLTVSEGILTPVFNSATTAYADTVSNSVASITVTPTTDDNNATVTVNGTPVVSGSASGVIPLVSGNNTITVVVTAQDGVTTDTYTVTVYKGEPPADMVATNVLTPNGDGKNDYWVIKDIELYPQNNVTVYDKGGRVVYAKHGYNNEWGGTLNGAPLAEGTYYFVVDLGPDLRKFKGYISILRN